MSGHSTILQRQHHGGPPWKPCRHQQGKDLARMCVYRLGMEADVTDYIKWCLTCIECNNLPVETLHPYEVPPRPWVKIGVDFFQDHLGKKHLIVADYFSSSHTCFQWHPVIISRPSATYENSLQLKACLPSSCLIMDLHSMEMSLDNFPVTLTSFIPHRHHTSINRTFHRVNGKEGQKHLQEDGRIPQCSGQSIASAT